jgi:hypothetical protein
MELIQGLLAILVSVALPAFILWVSINLLIGFFLNFWGIFGIIIAFVVIKNLFFSGPTP